MAQGRRTEASAALLRAVEAGDGSDATRRALQAARADRPLERLRPVD